MSLDLSKAFDRIEFVPLFQSLREQGVGGEYLSVLIAIYTQQPGRVRGSRCFDIQRGVKQGDILSPLLFNSGLEAALRRWKSKIAGSGVPIDSGDKLTNTRYADDLMLFARSCEELTNMAEHLREELARVGLQLNAAKTKILTTESDNSQLLIEVAGDFVEVVGTGAHTNTSEN